MPDSTRVQKGNPVKVVRKVFPVAYDPNNIVKSYRPIAEFPVTIRHADGGIQYVFVDSDIDGVEVVLAENHGRYAGSLYATTPSDVELLRMWYEKRNGRPRATAARGAQ